MMLDDMFCVAGRWWALTSCVLRTEAVFGDVRSPLRDGSVNALNDSGVSIYTADFTWYRWRRCQDRKMYKITCRQRALGCCSLENRHLMWYKCSK